MKDFAIESSLQEDITSAVFRSLSEKYGKESPKEFRQVACLFHSTDYMESLVCCALENENIVDVFIKDMMMFNSVEWPPIFSAF